jgi:hypothetical protein
MALKLTLPVVVSILPFPNSADIVSRLPGGELPKAAYETCRNATSYPLQLLRGTVPALPRSLTETYEITINMTIHITGRPRAA